MSKSAVMEKLEKKQLKKNVTFALGILYACIPALSKGKKNVSRYLPVL